MAGYGEIRLLSSAAFLAIFPDQDLGNPSMISANRVSHETDTSDNNILCKLYCLFSELKYGDYRQLERIKKGVKMSDSKILESRDNICTFLKIGKAIFYQLLAQGLPVKKIGRAWYGHRDVLEKWFRNYVENKENGSSDPADQEPEMSKQRNPHGSHMGLHKIVTDRRIDFLFFKMSILNFFKNFFSKF
jgi:hypothetical protein